MHGPVDTFFSVSPLSYVSVCYGGCRSFHYYYHLLSAGFVDDEEVISDSKLSTNAFKDANLSSSEPSKPPNNALSASSVALLCSLAFGVAPLDDELLKCAENHNCLNLQLLPTFTRDFERTNYRPKTNKEHGTPQEMM